MATTAAVPTSIILRPDFLDKLIKLAQLRQLNTQRVKVRSHKAVKKQHGRDFVTAYVSNGDGYRLALMGFDFLPEELELRRKEFAVYLERSGIDRETATREASGLKHSWEFAAYHLSNE